MPYRLLTEFAGLFTGKAYLHRNSGLGDWVAMQLYEDLVALGKSEKLAKRVESQEWAVNRANKRIGIKARRGDGTFGELVPGETPITDVGFAVSTGIIATVEIGTEVKILLRAADGDYFDSVTTCVPFIAAIRLPSKVSVTSIRKLRSLPSRAWLVGEYFRTKCD